MRKVMLNLSIKIENKIKRTDKDSNEMKFCFNFQPKESVFKRVVKLNEHDCSAPISTIWTEAHSLNTRLFSLHY